MCIMWTTTNWSFYHKHLISQTKKVKQQWIRSGRCSQLPTLHRTTTHISYWQMFADFLRVVTCAALQILWPGYEKHLKDTSRPNTVFSTQISLLRDSPPEHNFQSTKPHQTHKSGLKQWNVKKENNCTIES